MKNFEIYQKPPKANRLVNNGVAEVAEDYSDGAVSILRYELETFVCDGQYRSGVKKVLDTFLTNLGNNAAQPGVWISGFFGSGKSHLAKMLRNLWTDFTFADGATARSLAHLPDDVKEPLLELSTAGKRLGGLHAAAGKLGAGAGNNVRLALLRIVFKSKGLPESYSQASFVMWLKQEGYLAQVQSEVESHGRTLEQELPNMYVSPYIAKGLLKAYPGFANSEAEARQLLKSNFPQVTDISNDDMVLAIKEALSIDGKFPLTLIVLDEMQQYIGTDTDKAYKVQEVTEACCNHFSGKLLFVATGQTAMSGTPLLSKIQGRFPVSILLGDNDVDTVIRQIILAKKPSVSPQVDQVLKQNLGEICSHLRGTKLEHSRDDENDMVADYPILPVRRRFWERSLRHIDATGTVSQLRNQLRIVHEAVQASSEEELGNVVAGDFLYDQISSDLLSTAAMPLEIYEQIRRFAEGDATDLLKSKVLKLVYLINKLPNEVAEEIGLRATLTTLADLLVTNLQQGSNELRAALPTVLNSLQNDDRLIMALEGASGTEYRLQTRESSGWYEEYRAQETEIKNSTGKVETIRVDLFTKEIRTQLSKARTENHGKSGVPRSFELCFDRDLPKDHDKNLYIWVQDGWSTEEKGVIADARNKGADNPTIFVYIPDQNKGDLSNAIVSLEAASKTLERKGTPVGAEGQEARRAMESRQSHAEKEVKKLIGEIMAGVKVFQAGGQEVSAGNTLAERVTSAAKSSVIRLYREFDVADFAEWGSVLTEARKGSADAFKKIGHNTEPEKHPVSAKVLSFIGAQKKGADVRNNFTEAPYGWPQDAVDAVLYALLAAGILRATDASGQNVDAKSLDRQKLTQATFKPETVTVSTVQLIKLRKLFPELGLPSCNSGEETQRVPGLLAKLREQAQAAGGAAPRPENSLPDWLRNLELQSGNALLLEVLSQSENIVNHSKAWVAAAEAIALRMPIWAQLLGLLDHAKPLPGHEAIRAEQQAIIAQRSLLAEPDPVRPLLTQVSELLRQALNANWQDYADSYEREMTQLDTDSNWQKLDESNRAALLAQHSIKAPVPLKLASPQELEDALDECGIAYWNERRHGLTSRFEALRLAAAKLLEPKVIQAQLPRRTLRTEADVAAWLQEAEKTLLAKLANGPVIPA